ncbi:MAG TPA: acylphosphatase, partial [Burkholderiales bacterium]|nr:acylphosphatase [Burkholderiales bacterium]
MARHYRLWRAPARVCAAGRLTFFYGMVSVRLRISGRVQGVGFRYAMQAEAERRGLGGWVRNRRDGTVEALVHGDAAALEALVEAEGAAT